MIMHYPLDVLLTRPIEDSKRLERHFLERRIACFIEPMLEVRFSAERLAALKDHLEIKPHAILITSANGIRALARATEKRSFLLLAVGDTSAQEANDLGFAHVISAHGNVESLVMQVVNACKPGNGSLLHVAGSVTTGDLPGALIRQGFRVERCVAYESIAAASLSEALKRRLTQRPFTCALFYSQRTATTFAALLEREDLTPSIRATAALCLSAPVARALETLSFSAVHIAEEPSNNAMLALIDHIHGCTEPMNNHRSRHA